MRDEGLVNIGNRIRSRRIELGLSQEELKNKVGYSNRSMIARIERGDINITSSKIKAIATALDTTPAYLMGWEDEPEEPSYYLNDEAKEMADFLFKNPEYKVLFDASRKVKPEDITFVKEMMDRMRGNPND